MCLCMLEKNGSHLIHLFKVLRKGTKFNLKTDKDDFKTAKRFRRRCLGGKLFQNSEKHEELRKIFQEV